MSWLNVRASFGLRGIAAAILLTRSAAAIAGNLDLVTEGTVAESTFSDRLPNEGGQWRTKVQQIFDPKSQKIERRLYEYFDPAPTDQLDIVWYPEDARSDRPGRISGKGRLVWRQRGGLVWDPAAVVRVFAGEMRGGRPNGMGE